MRVQAILGGPAITAGELAAGRGRGSNWFKEVQSKRLPDRATSGSAGAGKRIDSVNDDVDTLAKPGKRWGGLEDKVIRAAAAAIIAFLLAKIGL